MDHFVWFVICCANTLGNKKIYISIYLHTKNTAIMEMYIFVLKNEKKTITF